MTYDSFLEYAAGSPMPPPSGPELVAAVAVLAVAGVSVAAHFRLDAGPKWRFLQSLVECADCGEGNPLTIKKAA